jgi:short-subunit dehydrogenase
MAIAGVKVLITGASSGIGAALARALAARGATVGLTARRADRLAEVLADCRRHAPGSRMWPADLDDLEAVERLGRDVLEGFGHLDILVNNAGIPKRRGVLEMRFDEVERVMRVNFLSAVRLTMAVLPGMVARGAGCVVNVASTNGRFGVYHQAAYCASKFALCGWSESLAQDLWETGVKVRLFLPGPIDTEMAGVPDNEPPPYDGPKVSATDAAEAIIAAVESDRFEHYLPDMKAAVEAKTADIDRFLEGMHRLVSGFRPGSGADARTVLDIFGGDIGTGR